MKNNKKLKILLFSSIAILFLFVLLRSTMKNTDIAWQTISGSDLEKRLPPKDFILLDVRSENEFNSGHIPGSINIPIQNLERDINKLNGDAEIVVYCLSGKRSSRAVSILSLYNFPDIKNYVAGMSGWKGPVVK